MPSIDEEAKAWQLAQSARIGRAVARRRTRLGMTAVDLAERTRDLGYPITRVAISKIENNARAGKIDIAEVAVLAAALRIPPVLLVYPDLPSGEVAALPETEPVETYNALRWFTGDLSVGSSLTSDDSVRLLALVGKYAPVRSDWSVARVRAMRNNSDPELAAALTEVRQLVDQLEGAMQEMHRSVFGE